MLPARTTEAEGPLISGCKVRIQRQHVRVKAAFRILTALVALICSVAQAVSAGGPPPKPTFTEHIAPIIFENCSSCHRPGEIGPFSLLTYEDVRKRARQIAEVAASKFMPPWHAESGHVELADPRVLTEAQITTLKRWSETGTPEGNRKKLPKLPAFTEGWQAGKPDLILKMPEPFKLYAEGKDIYRNFVFPLNLPEDKYVRAVEFRPGNRSIVHHALFFLDESGTAREADAAEEGPGYSDKGNAMRQFSPVGGWAVGSNVRQLPDGLAYRYPKSADFVVQTHFHPTGKDEEEVTTIGLYFAPKPARSFVGVQVPPAFGQISGIDIAAGVSNYVVRDAFTLPVDVEGFGIAAHAHYLGKVFTMKAVLPDQKELILLRMPDWDFAWQEQYNFQQWVKLPKGTRLETEIVYDNSATNPRNPTSPPVRVRWGTGSTDEMGSITLQVIPVREEEAKILREELRGHAADLLIDRVGKTGAGRRGNWAKAMFDQFDKNRDGELGEDERLPLRNFIKQSPFLPGGLNNTF